MDQLLAKSTPEGMVSCEDEKIRKIGTEEKLAINRLTKEEA